MRLGEGFYIPEPEAPPEPSLESRLLRQLLARIDEMAALRGEPIVVPAPEVRVEAPPVDLSEVFELVASQKPGATADEIGAAVARYLAPAGDDSAVFAELLAAIKALESRVTGVGMQAFGASGPSNISDNESRKLGVVKSITDPVATTPQVRETRFDYDGRTDSSPVYAGTAAPGTLTSAASWKVQKFTYDASNRATRVQVQEGIAWDDRATGW